MTRRLIVWVALIATTVLSVGCDLLSGSDGERVVGIIGGERTGEALVAGFVTDEDPCLSPVDAEPHCYLQAPDTVEAGQPFQVRVQTASIGGTGWSRADGAEISASPRLFEIVPYDRYFPDRGSIDADWWLVRTLELVFPEPGEALLRLTGRVVLLGEGGLGSEGSGGREYRLGSIEHPVMVR